MFLEQIFSKHPFVLGSHYKALNKTNVALVPHLIELMLMRKKYIKIVNTPTHMTADCANCCKRTKKFFEKEYLNLRGGLVYFRWCDVGRLFKGMAAQLRFEREVISCVVGGKRGPGRKNRIWEDAEILSD